MCTKILISLGEVYAVEAYQLDEIKSTMKIVGIYRKAYGALNAWTAGSLILKSLLSCLIGPTKSFSLNAE